MKKILSFTAILLAAFSFAQNVGVNTNAPQATLDVVGQPTDATKADGVIAPRLTLTQLNAKSAYAAAQTGAIIYVTDVTGGSTVLSTQGIGAPGYYYFDGTNWASMTSKSGSALFIASTGQGAGAQINATLTQNAFLTVPLTTVTKNVGGGTWDSQNNEYTVPFSGTYIIKSSVRLTDGSASRNIFQAVGVSNSDIPDGIWQTNVGGQRFTMLYTRIAYFSAGDKLRLYIFSDGAPANISDASLNIINLSAN